MGGDTDVSVMLGDPRRAVRLMALPLLVSLLVSELNTAIDRAWCSGLGNEPLAAIAVVAPVFMVLMGLGTGLGVGVSAVVSRHIGAGDPSKASDRGAQAVMFALVFGLVLTPVFLLSAGSILDIIGSEDINGLSLTYMSVLMLFTPILVLNGTVAGLLRGEGAARMATAMMLISAVVNMVLDPLLIYVLDMGIAGAAWATSLSVLVSTAFGLLLYATGHTYLRLGFRGFRFRREGLGDVLAMGVPQMLEYTVMYAMNIVLNYLVLYCGGSTGLTVYSVPNLVMNIAIIPAFAIGSALVPVASSAFGQGDMARMHDSYRYSLKLSLCVVLAITAVVMLVPQLFLLPFTYTPEMEVLRGQMAQALRIYAIYLPFFVFIPIGSSLLQALMMPNRSVVLAVVRNLILILFYAIAAQHELYWIFWAVVFGEVIGGLMMYAVAGGSFKRKVQGTGPA